MVVKEKQALKAIHRLLIEGRRLSREGMSGPDSFTYFDELEGLMGYVIAWQEDRSDFFESELGRVCNEVKAPHILKRFKRS
ncbi:hypothetical protein [Hymenobacter bucti]|uniref:Uncharacterized protein n=1 Tax=Hymenobacter bucti TaxID=1844114 RepID=A0ABW4QVQ5_9BACT